MARKIGRRGGLSYNPSNLPNQDTSAPLHAWHVLLIYARASKANTTAVETRRGPGRLVVDEMLLRKDR